MVYNPKIHRAIPLNMSPGFPDFLAYKTDNYEVIGVESKMSRKLDKTEVNQCRWYIRNKIFSKILIAYKEKRGRRIQS